MKKPVTAAPPVPRAPGSVTGMRPASRAPLPPAPGEGRSPFSPDLVQAMERIAQEPRGLRPSERRPAGPTPRPAPPERPALVVAEPCVAGYRYRSLFLMVWRGDPTARAIQELHEGVLSCMADHPKVAIVSLILEGATPPSAELRAQVREFQTANGARISALALVVKGVGFWASAIIAAATAIVRTRRTPFPYRVFRHDPTAASFLAESIAAFDGATTEADIVEAFSYVRADRPMRSL